MRFWNIFILLILFIKVSAQDQSLYVIEHKCPGVSINNFVIKGIVYDTLTNEELPNATVYVKGTKIGAMTNDKGIFSFDISSIGDTSRNISLIVSYISYHTKEIDISNKINLGGFISAPMKGRDNAIYCPDINISQPKKKRKN